MARRAPEFSGSKAVGRSRIEDVSMPRRKRPAAMAMAMARRAPEAAKAFQVQRQEEA